VGGRISLSDATRRPRGVSVITISIVATNALVFVLELAGDDASINRWREVRAEIVYGAPKSPPSNNEGRGTPIFQLKSRTTRQGSAGSER